jgi:hypothetical protein
MVVVDFFFTTSSFGAAADDDVALFVFVRGQSSNVCPIPLHFAQRRRFGFFVGTLCCRPGKLTAVHEDDLCPCSPQFEHEEGFLGCLPMVDCAE